MEHTLYEVFKHPAPFGKLKWCIQFQGGIASYRIKRIATEVSSKCKEIEHRAAAPAMLEALIDAVEHCYMCAGTSKRSARSAGLTSEWECGFCDKQRAAIKLATGAA